MSVSRTISEIFSIK